MANESIFSRNRSFRNDRFPARYQNPTPRTESLVENFKISGIGKVDKPL